MTRVGGKVTVEILPARGTYKGALKERKWVVRLHKAADATTKTMPFELSGVFDTNTLAGPVTSHLVATFNTP
jgi:hypothetical protein